MAKKTSKKKTTKKASSKKKTTKKKSSRSSSASESASRKKLVIVESPAKAKTINKYLGSDYIVKASVGHIRDLPSKNPKGDKRPVPGVNLDKRFEPTYTVLEGKNKTVTDLKRAAKQADEVWFATDLDREGEAIAWHLAELLKIDPRTAKRVVFNAITKKEIVEAFEKPHEIDLAKVDAQQARRILDRIVGYQVSPLLWKKVARGLSAGRVQSVAVRLVVEREREIDAFVPDESWRVTGRFAIDPSTADGLVGAWASFMETPDEKGNAPTLKAQNAWLAERKGLKAELVEVDGEPFDVSQAGDGERDLTDEVMKILESAGMEGLGASVEEDPKGKGPARYRRTIAGTVRTDAPFAIESIETKRTTSRPGAPFITSTLQQGASSRLSYGAQKTMRTAQRLYEAGHITYMRTDSTHLSGAALSMARDFISEEFDDAYLPDKPNFFGSTNKAAQEAHEAIRPTDVRRTPEMMKKELDSDQWKLYDLIWKRFVACQMTNAQWDSTGIRISGGSGPKTLTFRATGRVLVFDGFMRVMGVPTSSDEQTLPAIAEGDVVAPFSIEPQQTFSSPPARYSEASLIKTLESEGIGRPSTYASIIQVIQDRKYVEQLQRRFYATDLGEVVTDKLIEAFPEIMELGYTRDMEDQLDKIEEEHRDWRDVLDGFYKPFKLKLAEAEENLTHAKAELTPAPYECPLCGSDTVYRFGKNGRFLSCSTYPKCTYSSPINRAGEPQP
ncbi:MAG: DNA topoisomerase, partial [Planctomycetota bacterium]